ncbi:membrane transporter [Coprinopsis cinerea okayama7|uniref:Membrane transporter n=1 Tax=Coprinopsis cinerea (strain Okayama-7 / 130 / ATCC MYA-4618 / FGSC 9003) TaxID=240176 RepID=D6RQ21_COPC7|nr:membrane transporter [Coprinopsis cinerea okayama7\|eukprot:XP_002910435.1 membrane transporter [Coprinopsis cinerea okayama7\
MTRTAKPKGTDAKPSRHAETASLETADAPPMTTAAVVSPEIEKGKEYPYQDSPYDHKLKVLNGAMQTIGFGKYHRRLAVVAGFGWFIDGALPLLAGLLIPTLISEFKIDGAYFVVTVYSGMLAGACIWGVASDLLGRVLPFNLTLLVSGVFALASGGANNFATLAILVGLMGFGAGGNIPIDSAIFLEFMPSTHANLLTTLSMYWIFGNILMTLAAWPLMTYYSCEFAAEGQICRKEDNMGWRYLMFIIGSCTIVLWAIRFWLFPIYESPRYLLGRGREEEAVQVVQRIAAFNGVPTSLSVEDFRVARRDDGGEDATKTLSIFEKARFVAQRVKALFQPAKTAVSTVILIVLWSSIGLGTALYYSFLPYLLASKGAVFGDASLSIVYRNATPYLASKAVDLPYLGRRWTMSFTCVLSGACLLGSTTSRSSNALLGWNCGYSFASNAMYAVMYSFTSEVFPTPNRGTGNALVSIFGRISNVIAPLIALHLDVRGSAPAYIGGGLTTAAAILPLLVQYEPRGKEVI